MKRNILIVIVLNILVLAAVTWIYRDDDKVDLQLEGLKLKYAFKHKPSVNHSKLPALQKQFKTPQEVTEACNTCHTESHKEVMASSHWNWGRVGYIEDRGLKFLGKKNALNNFCLGSKSNEQACAKCHIGYGMNNNDQYNFKDSRNVDCMVCHDNSETYQKGASMAGYPDRSVNLEKVALSVGQPKKSNCGSCHFYSGGGNNVKHGDLDDAQLNCSREVDVHMSTKGSDLECVACHTAKNHQIKGRLYSVSSDHSNRATCEQCHSSTPHLEATLNKHTSKVACQTCHIPEYAKVNATKMAWYWSKAGVMKDGKPYESEDSMGNHDYMSIKGKFEWKKNAKPDYVWFNGTAKHYLSGDKITERPVKMNTLLGSYNDPNAKIIPVKIHRGDQIYDKKNNYLIVPKLYAPQKGDSAYWSDFNWKLAAEAGMKRIGLPFSGEYGFIETEMYWPINHQVAPKENALACSECHRHENGRLAKLTGFYMPGRDRNSTLDFIGIFFVLASVAGVVIHNLSRILTAYRKKRIEMQIINFKDDE